MTEIRAIPVRMTSALLYERAPAPPDIIEALNRHFREERREDYPIGGLHTRTITARTGVHLRARLRDPLTNTQVFVRQFSFPMKGDSLDMYEERLARTSLYKNSMTTYRIVLCILSFIPGVGLLLYLCRGACLCLGSKGISQLYKSYTSKREQKAALAKMILICVGIACLLLPVYIIGTVIKAIQRLNEQKRARRVQTPIISSIDPKVIL